MHMEIKSMSKWNVFSKHNSVLLLLLLVFCSCGVSFGMDENKSKENVKNEIKDKLSLQIPKLAPRNRYLGVPLAINILSRWFVTTFTSVKEEDFCCKKEENDIKTLRKILHTLNIPGLFDATILYCHVEKVDANWYYMKYLFIRGNMVCQSLYRGFWSTRPCWKKFNDGGNWELYFGIGNVTSPYLGAVLNLALVCKPNFILKHLPRALQDKVTIHIVDFKLLNFLVGCVLSTCLMWHTKYGQLYIRPQWIVGLFTVEIKCFNKYNISLNLGSWILDLIMYKIYNKEAKELIKWELKDKTLNEHE